MIQLVPADENGRRTIMSDQDRIYILVQGEYKFHLDRNEIGQFTSTEQLLFTNDDISPQGRTDLVNYVMDFIANNPF